MSEGGRVTLYKNERRGQGKVKKYQEECREEKDAEDAVTTKGSRLSIQVGVEMIMGKGEGMVVHMGERG